MSYLNNPYIFLINVYFMLKRGMSKGEIEKELSTKGEFVQIDYLGAFLKEDLPTDIRKFAMVKMAELYEKKYMFTEAAKIYNNLSIISIPFKEKIEYHVKEAEMHIKAGNFRESDSIIPFLIPASNT